MNKEQIKKELEEMKESKINFEEYQKCFNKEFNTKVKIRDTDIPILKILADEFVWRDYKRTNIYNYLSEKIVDLEEKLIYKLSVEQKEMYELIDLLEKERAIDFAEQAFIFGFIIAQQLSTERAHFVEKHNL